MANAPAAPWQNRRSLLNGDLVSLKAESQEDDTPYRTTHYVQVANAITTDVTSVDQDAITAFEDTCIFQLLSTDADKAALGTPLQYGDRVVFVHSKTSRRWILKDREKVMVKDHPLPAESEFKLLPFFKHVKPGDPVHFGDLVLVQCGTTEPTLYLNLDEMTERLVPDTKAGLAGLRMALFAPWDTASDLQKGVIKGGALVRLYHPHERGFLVTVEKEMRTENNTFETESLTVRFQQLPDSYDPHMFHDISGLFQVVKQEGKGSAGGPIHWTDVIALRSVSTGKYLDTAAVMDLPAQDAVVWSSGRDLHRPNAGGSDGQPAGDAHDPHMLEESRTRSVSSNKVKVMALSDERESTTRLNLMPADGLDVNQNRRSEEERRIQETDYFYIRGSPTVPLPASSLNAAWLNVDMSGDSQSTVDETDYHQALFKKGKLPDKDAWTLFVVDAQETHDFDQAHVQVKEIKSLLALSAQEINAKPPEYHRALQAFDFMIQFCTRDDELADMMKHDGVPNPSKQEMLLDLDIDDLVMELVVKPFIKSEAQSGSAKLNWEYGGQDGGLTIVQLWTMTAYNTLCRRALRVLRQMAKLNERVGRVIAKKYLKRFMHVCRLTGQPNAAAGPSDHAPHWEAADALRGIVTDNTGVMQLMSAAYIKVWAERLKECEMPLQLNQYLALLGAFCSSNGDAVPAHQDIIATMLLKPGDGFAILPAYNSATKTISFSRYTAGENYTGWPTQPMKLEEFFKKLAEAGADGTHEGLADYHEECLNLMAQLCYGRNAKSQQIIRKHFVPFEMFQKAIKNTHLGYAMRAAYIRLGINLFIDRDPMQERTVVLNRYWEDLKEDQQTKLVTKEAQSLFPQKSASLKDLKDWIFGYFGTTLVPRDSAIFSSRGVFGRFRGNKRDSKSSAGQAIEMSNPTQTKLQMTLSSHLETRANDVMSPAVQRKFEAELADQEDHNLLTKSVLELLDALVVFGFFVHRRERERVAEVMFELLKATQPTSPHEYALTAAHTVIMDAKKVACGILTKLLDTFKSDGLSKILLDYKEFRTDQWGGRKVTSPQRLMRRTIDNAVWEGSYDDDAASMYASLAPILLRLAAYEDPHLCIAALDVLFAMSNQKSELLRMLDEVVIVNDEVQVNFLKNLRRGVKQFEQKKNMLELLQKLSKQCVTEKSAGYEGSSMSSLAGQSDGRSSAWDLRRRMGKNDADTQSVETRFEHNIKVLNQLFGDTIASLLDADDGSDGMTRKQFKKYLQEHRIKLAPSSVNRMMSGKTIKFGSFETYMRKSAKRMAHIASLNLAHHRLRDDDDEEADDERLQLLSSLEDASSSGLAPASAVDSSFIQSESSFVDDTVMAEAEAVDQFDDEDVEPDDVRQNMIRNENVHVKVLEQIMEEVGVNIAWSSVLQYMQTEEHRKLLVWSFRFLGLFCWGNELNQDELGDRKYFEFLVRAAKYGVGAEKTIHRLLEGNVGVHGEQVDVEVVKELVRPTHFENGTVRPFTRSYIDMLRVLVSPSENASVRDLQGPMLEGLQNEDLYDGLYRRSATADHFADGSMGEGRFLSFIAECYEAEDDAVSDEDQHLCAFYQSLTRLFLVICEDNPTTRTQLADELGLEICIEPLVRTRARRGMDYSGKESIINLIKELHFSDSDQIENQVSRGPQSNQESLRELDDEAAERHNRAGEKQIRNISLLVEALRQEALDIQEHLSETNDTAEVQDIDMYVVNVLLPCGLAAIRHTAVQIRHFMTAGLYVKDGFLGVFGKIVRGLVHEAVAYLAKRREGTDTIRVRQTVRAAGEKMLDGLYDLFQIRFLRELLADSAEDGGGEERQFVELELGKWQRWGQQVKPEEHKGTALRGLLRGKMSREVSNIIHSPAHVAATFSEAPASTQGAEIREGLAQLVQTAREVLKGTGGPPSDDIDRTAIQWLAQPVAREYNFDDFWKLVYFLRDALKGEEVADEGAAEADAPAARVDKASILECLRHVANHLRELTIEAEGDVSDEVEGIMTDTLAVLCGCISRERKSTTVADVQRMAGLFNQNGIPQVALNMLMAREDALVDYGLRLAVELLMASPVESMTDDALANGKSGQAVVHPHSQRALMDVLNDKFIGRQALFVGFEAKLTEFNEQLIKRRDEEAGVLPRSQMDLEDRDNRTMLGILMFLERMAAGAFSDAQDWMTDQQIDGLPDIDLVRLLVDMTDSYSALVQQKMEFARTHQDATNPRMIGASYPSLRRELNDGKVMAQIYRTLASLVTGPHHANQKALFQTTPLDCMFRCLFYIQYDHDDEEDVNEDQNGGQPVKQVPVPHALNDYVQSFESSMEQWMKNFKVERQHNGKFVAKSGSTVSTSTLDELWQVQDVLDQLNSVDEECEYAILTLLISVMEGRPPTDPLYNELCVYCCHQPSIIGAGRVKEIKNNLDILVYNMTIHLELMKERSEQGGRAVSHEDVCFLYYVFLIQISEHSDTFESNYVERRLEEWEQQPHAGDLTRQLGSVEFIGSGKDHVLTVLRFRIPTFVYAVHEQDSILRIKDEMINATILLKPDEKVKAFIKMCPKILRALRIQGLYEHRIVLKILSEEGTAARMAYAIVLFLNVYRVIRTGNANWDYFADGLSYLHVLLSVMKVFALLLNDVPLHMVDWNEERDGIREDEDKRWMSLVGAFVLFWVWQTQLVWVTVYLATSLLGAMEEKYWFVIHLFDMKMLPSMNAVVQSITQNISRLLATFLLMIMTVYAFSTVAFESSKIGEYALGDAPEEPALCSGEYKDCLRDHLYYGLIEAPAFAEEMNFGTLVFGFCYWVIVTTVMASIVTGIIIDSFSEIRDEQNSIDDAKEEACFVCSIPYSELDAACRDGFGGHVEKEHNEYNYVKFLLYLTLKNENNEPFTGNEMAVWNEWKKNSLHKIWPINRAMCIDAASEPGDERHDVLLDRIGALGTQIESMELKSSAEAPQQAPRTEDLGGAPPTPRMRGERKSGGMMPPLNLPAHLAGGSGQGGPGAGTEALEAVVDELQHRIKTLQKDQKLAEKAAQKAAQDARAESRTNNLMMESTLQKIISQLADMRKGVAATPRASPVGSTTTASAPAGLGAAQPTGARQGPGAVQAGKSSSLLANALQRSRQRRSSADLKVTRVPKDGNRGGGSFISDDDDDDDDDDAQQQ